MTGTLGESVLALAERFRANTGGWQPYFDFSVGSGVVIDNFIDLLLSTGDPISQVVQMGMGAYVGEIIRRAAGGEWIAMPDGPTPDDPGLSANGIWLFPYEKVRKRIALGSSHGIGLFIEELVQAVNLPAPEREVRWAPFRRKGD